MTSLIYIPGPYQLASSTDALTLDTDNAVRLEDWFAPDLDRSGAPGFHFAHQILAAMYGRQNSKGEKVFFTAHWYWMAPSTFIVDGISWRQFE
jgi:hypothetical protein